MKQLKVSKMGNFKYVLSLLLLLLPAMNSFSAIPLLINYQGNVKDGTGTPINGTGYFKFAIVNQAGDTAYWVNNGTTMDGSEPPNAVSAAVSDGVFAVKLGDTNLTNMVELTQSVFDNDTIYLRVWFSTDNQNFEQFSSDFQMVSTGFAFKAAVADTVIDSAVTSVTIEDNSITNADISGTAAIAATKIDSTGLDADTLDGNDSTAFAATGHGHNYAGSASDGGAASDLSCTSCVSSSEIDPAGLDADTLDGNNSTDFSASGHTHPNDGDWTVSGNNVYSAVSGNVGIGTSSPVDPLHIVGNRLRLQFTAGQAAAGLTIVPSTNTEFTGFLWVTAADGITYKANAYYEHTNSRLVFTNNGTGNLTGVYLADGGITWTSTSDRRLKENVKNTSYGLDEVLQIPVREYNFKDSPNKKKIGLIAQEVYPIVPELVTKGDEGEFTDTSIPWGVDYAGLSPVLIKSIQELHKLVTTQQKIIEIQSREIELLKAKVGGL